MCLARNLVHQWNLNLKHQCTSLLEHIAQKTAFPSWEFFTSLNCWDSSRNWFGNSVLLLNAHYSNTSVISMCVGIFACDQVKVSMRKYKTEQSDSSERGNSGGSDVTNNFLLIPGNFRSSSLIGCQSCQGGNILFFLQFVGLYLLVKMIRLLWTKTGRAVFSKHGWKEPSALQKVSVNNSPKCFLVQVDTNLWSKLVCLPKIS